MAEFALAAPIFFLLLFMIIEGGRFIFYNEALNNATRAGVRYAIIHGANASCSSGGPSGPMLNPPGCWDPAGDDVRKAISDAAFSLAGAGEMTIPDPVYSGPNGNSNARGSNVNVSVSFTYQPLMPLLPPITIRAEANGVVNN